ncbi:MAG: hypothetical protein WC787_02585 [Patescibacteria group bacterium]|jgi:hypothetical protein
MTINRDEIREALRASARDKTNIDPAMQLAEPLFVAIDGGFRFEQYKPVTNEEIRDAIRDGVKETTVYPKRISILRRSTAEEGFLRTPNVGPGFGAAVTTTVFGAHHGMMGMYLKSLHQFSPSLPLIIQQVFTNHVAARVEVTYGTHSAVSKNAWEKARESVEMILHCYLNLTVMGNVLAIKHHIKRPLLLLPRAIPLARVNGKDGPWTVLTS